MANVRRRDGPQNSYGAVKSLPATLAINIWPRCGQPLPQLMTRVTRTTSRQVVPDSRLLTRDSRLQTFSYVFSLKRTFGNDR
jgi:hypothetical protein